MMTETQRAKVVELRAAITATASSREGASAEVRAAAVALKKELHREGTTARELGAALGVHVSTLCRWKQEGRSTRDAGRSLARPGMTSAGVSGFRAVQLAAPETRSTRSLPEVMFSGTSQGLRVAHAPSGLVIDGLDVETLAALLRRMS